MCNSFLNTTIITVTLMKNNLTLSQSYSDLYEFCKMNVQKLVQ